MRIRGLGIAAPTDASAAEPIAALAEELGYSSIWTNDTPAADGLEVAAAMARATKAIRIGVGVIPVDRRPAAQILEHLSKGDLPTERMILGVGSGLSPKPLQAVRVAVEELRNRSQIKIAVAAMGPQMCKLAATLGDLVLLNWMSPSLIGKARRIMGGDARGARPQVAAYVRVAAGSGATERLHEEAARYGMLPHYQRNFARSDKSPPGIAAAGEDLNPLIAPYEAVLDETVVRPIPSTDELSEVASIARLCSPRPG